MCEKRNTLKLSANMKRKHLIILSLTIILVFVALFLVFNRGTGTFKDSAKEFAVKDTATITKVFLADKNNRTIFWDKFLKISKDGMCDCISFAVIN